MFTTFRPDRWTWPLLSALLTLCVQRNADAGLVFQLEDEISAQSVQMVKATPRGLVFQIANHEQVLEMPLALQRYVADWAEAYRGGVVIVSIDSALVPGGATYTPPSTPLPLRGLLTSWDAQAHALSCGGIPLGQPKRHPLFARDGDDRNFPAQRHAHLLDASKAELDAFSYRHLAARYASPPACVGELTLRVSASKGPWPMQLSVNSWIHPQMNLWYRSIDAPSPRDQILARLPYRELKRDVEERWFLYRQAFPTMERLSSVVEALAILHAVRTQKPALWRALRRDLAQVRGPIPPSPLADLAGQRLAVEPWQQVARSWIGQHVETSAQANLALNLINEADIDERSERMWLTEIAALAANDRRLTAKLELFQALRSPTAELCTDTARVWSVLQLLQEGEPDSFRLRARGVSLLESKLRDCKGALRTIMGFESERLLQAFLAKARPLCTETPGAPDDRGVWEELTQDVYSVGLLARASRSELFGDVLDAVACVHHRRALSPQTGRALGFRHAHLRYLMLLKRSTSDPELTARIDRYANEIATAMHLAEW